MEQLRAKGTSLIFISHNLDAVRQVCDRGLVMYHGEAIFQGTAAEAVIAYSDAIRQAARQTRIQLPREGGLSERVITFDAEIEKVSLCDDGGKQVTTLLSGTDVTVAMDVVCHKDVHHPVFACTIRTFDGRVAYDTTTHWQKMETPDLFANQHYRVGFQLKLHLLEGIYELGVDIAAADLSHYYDRLERALSFSVVGSNGAKGIVNLEAKLVFQELNVRQPEHEYAYR